jgi:3-oxoacyl-[acyl-carrier protein] reductase
MSSSNNKVAIITGGSRGVGAATANLLASKGWNVVITCTSSIAEAEEVVKKCKSLNVDALAISANVKDNDACQDTIKKTLDKWGRIDSLINNAGTTKFANHANLEALSAEDFQNIYAVNVIGPFQMVRAAKETLLVSEDPSIVNVSSIAGVKGVGSSLAYAASKGALNTMTLSMARNLGPIRVNAVCPGFIQGEWLKNGLGEKVYNAAMNNFEATTPLKLTCTPEDVAIAIDSFINGSKVITGETLILDGGWHLAT